MKKFVVFVILFFMCILNTNALTSKSSILIESTTGEVLMENKSFEHLAPASMTKIMTLLIIMENIESGKIKLTDKVTISENASSMGGSQVFLNPGEEISVDNLIESICIASANDSAVALAEKIAGSEEKFVELMNYKVKELGLKDTVFKNVHGLDTEGHYSCSHDMAFIARKLLKYQSILKYTSTYESYFKKNDGSSIWMVNTNKLIRYYNGLDGLKTGFTDKAGYCLTSTAKRNNMRLITVVMGESTSELRSKDTIELLDYGFNNYKLNTVLKKNIDLGTINIFNSKKNKVKIRLYDDVTNLENIEDNNKYTYKLILNKVKAPLKKDDVVGKINLYKNNKYIKNINVVVDYEVSKANYYDYVKRNIKYFIVGSI